MSKSGSFCPSSPLFTTTLKKVVTTRKSLEPNRNQLESIQKDIKRYKRVTDRQLRVDRL